MGAIVEFYMQGSEPEPYRLEISFDPYFISCTCKAARVGTPCKHRLHAFNGHTYNILDLTPEIENAVKLFSEIMKNSDIPKYLKDYEQAKNDIYDINIKADKAFQSYKNAIVANALGNGTEKKIKKAAAALDEAIQECVNIAAEKEGIIQAIRTVFVRPDMY